MSEQKHALTVLVVPDCPSTARALELARDVLTATGTEATLTTLTIHDQAQADLLGFAGSPSFHLDGLDLFPVDAPPAIACRVYPTPAGLRGTPTLRDLTTALESTRE